MKKHSDTEMPSKIHEKGAVWFERRIRVNIFFQVSSLLSLPRNYLQ